MEKGQSFPCKLALSPFFKTCLPLSRCPLIRPSTLIKARNMCLSHFGHKVPHPHFHRSAVAVFLHLVHVMRLDPTFPYILYFSMSFGPQHVWHVTVLSSSFLQVGPSGIAGSSIQLSFVLISRFLIHAMSVPLYAIGLH